MYTKPAVLNVVMATEAIQGTSQKIGGSNDGLQSTVPGYGSDE